MSKYLIAKTKKNMLVEHYYPTCKTDFELDDYLSKGWFRSSASLFRAEILCFEEILHTVINVRLPLSNYQVKKRHRRIKRNVTNRFTVTVQPFQISLEKEALYQSHKHRFKGFLQKNLFKYLNGEERSESDAPIFNTYEVNVFDGNQLIAFSLFDVGTTSIASILGVFHPDYEKYSLGTFTMLREIEFAKSLDYALYYPGYILHNTTLFDYKLRLGNHMEFYNQDKIWKPISERSSLVLKSKVLENKIEEAKAIIDLFEIPCKKITYPAFALAYFNFEEIYFVRSPIFLLLFVEEVSNNALIVEYWAEREEYVISEIDISSKFSQQNLISISDEALNSKTNCLDLLTYNYILVQENHPTEMMSVFIDQIKSFHSN